jgi:hypothetical protein
MGVLSPFFPKFKNFSLTFSGNSVDSPGEKIRLLHNYKMY